MSLQKSNNRKVFKEKFFTMGFLSISLMNVVIFLGLLFWLLLNGMPVLSLRFLITKSSVLRGIAAIGDYLLNTLILLVGTLLLSGVLGVMAALYVCEYVKDRKMIPILSLAVEILSGIPSIVYGLFGMVFFGERMGFGYSLWTGILTLSIMVLPIMFTSAKESFGMVSGQNKIGALALGAGKWYMIRTILLPEAFSGIGAGIVLSVGKVLGESAALLFTAGSRGSLAVGIYRMLGRGEFRECYGASLILLFLIFGVELAVQNLKESRGR